jgi:hypothetical protein
MRRPTSQRAAFESLSVGLQSKLKRFSVNPAPDSPLNGRRCFGPQQVT